MYIAMSFLLYVCVSGSPLGSFLEVHGEEEAAAAENDEKENEETQVVIDKGTLDATVRGRLCPFYHGTLCHWILPAPWTPPATTFPSFLHTFIVRFVTSSS